MPSHEQNLWQKYVNDILWSVSRHFELQLSDLILLIERSFMISNNNKWVYEYGFFVQHRPTNKQYWVQATYFADIEELTHYLCFELEDHKEAETKLPIYKKPL